MVIVTILNDIVMLWVESMNAALNHDTTRKILQYER